MLNDLLAGMQNDITAYVVYGEAMMVWMISIVILFKYEEREDETQTRSIR